MEDVMLYRADTSELEEILSEINTIVSVTPALFESLPGFFKRFIDGTDNGHRLVRLEQKSTVGASELVISVKPTKRLLKLLTTLRARQSELLIASTE